MQLRDAPAIYAQYSPICIAITYMHGPTVRKKEPGLPLIKLPPQILFLANHLVHTRGTKEQKIRSHTFITCT